MSDLAIDRRSEVRLHFSLALTDGTIIDSTFERPPVTLVIGDGNLLPGFEALLIGLKEGADQTFRVGPEQGFGTWRSENVQRIPRGQFIVDTPLVVGLVLSFAGAGSAETPGVVKTVVADFVDVDFNHPLAGREILFRVCIESVRDARNPDLIAVEARPIGGMASR